MQPQPEATTAGAFDGDAGITIDQTALQQQAHTQGVLEGLMPASSQGPDTDTSFYRPGVGFNLIAGPVGTARVRWAFRPQWAGTP